MALKKLGAVVFFRISLFLAFLLVTLSVILSLAALQSSSSLQLLPLIFSATRGSATLHEFSQLNTLASIDVQHRFPSDVVDKDKIDEMMARYYLSLRYEQYPDKNEMLYRWGVNGPLYLLSLPTVYSAFVGDLNKKLENLSDSVISVEIKKIERSDNRFDVTFRLYELLPDNQVRMRDKNVIMAFRYFPARRRFSRIFTNPYGLVFTRFEEADVKSSKN